MKVEFLERFVKDLDKIKDKYLKKSLVVLVHKLELVKDLHDIPNVKKLEGHKDAFRIRLGDLE
jgi:mRNA-degrading endonuclease RelE of RelBE toxin-antitoxin system